MKNISSTLLHRRTLKSLFDVRVKEPLEILRDAIDRLESVRAVPFQINKISDWNTHYLTLNLSTKYKVALTLNMLQQLGLLLILSLGSPVKIAQQIQTQGLIGAVVPVIVLLAVSTSVLLQIGSCIYRHEVITFTNKFLQLENLRSPIDGGEHRSSLLVKSLELLVVSAIPVSFSVFTYLLRPAVALNFGFAFFGPYHWTGYIFAVYATWFCYHSWVLTTFYIVLVFCYIYTTTSTFYSLT
jgi:hypothetical protein